MSLELNTSISFLKNRVDKTFAVQRQIAASWVWPFKTVADWEADSLQLDTTQPDTVAAGALEASTAEQKAQGTLDRRYAAIHAQTVSTLGVMRVRARRQPQYAHVINVLSARGDTSREIEDEGTALLSAWKIEFDGNAFSPAPDITFDAFSALFFGKPAKNGAAAVPSLRDLKQAVSDAGTIERREVGRLNSLLTRTEGDCQHWYAEATSAFASGTEIGDLVRSEVPTTTDYGSSTPKPAPTPAPAPALVGVK